MSALNADQRSIGIDLLIMCCKAVLSRGSALRCGLFNNKVPSFAMLERYIQNSPNILFTNEDVGLPKEIKGAVFKKRTAEQNVSQRFLYLIYLAKDIDSRIKRLFVLIHELAHVLLHGRIMQPGMMLNLTSQEWKTDSTTNRQIETEANIFVLIALIPDRLIETTRQCVDELDGEREIALVLRDTLSEIYQESFPLCLVKDRMLVDRLLRAQPRSRAIEHALQSMAFRSWVGSGTDYSYSVEDDTPSRTNACLIEKILRKSQVT